MKRYSKRVREEAALICAIAASSVSIYPVYDAFAASVAEHPDSLWLARKAWKRAMEGPPPASHWTRVVDAEAEALIRTGWSP